MEIKATSTNVPILVKMRLLGIVQTLLQHQAQYGSPVSVNYELIIQSVDKVTKDTTLTYNAGLSTADGIYFSLPGTLLDKENTVLRAALKFTYDTTIDFAKHNFEIKVTKATSPNVK